jgi:hypothetical protein
LIGETASGKTLLKDLHNYIFDGGGQPLKYMTGATLFNGELSACCSWHIDDKLNDLGYKGKKKLKAECKEIAVAGELRFEFKNQTAFIANPCMRLLICCNYTEDSVSVIPDIDESTKNKISILNCTRMAQLKSEMPAFIYHVLYEHIISEGMADVEEARMGVRGYHNEEAMMFVDSYSHDGSRLLTIIDCLGEHLKQGQELWRGNASSLVKFLQSHGLEQMATATSMGRFLNQRISSGTSLVRSVSHREYEIYLKEAKAGGRTQNEQKLKKSSSGSEVCFEQDESDFDEDAPYGYPFENK